MGFKCGNCNIEFSTRKEWLDHLVDVHNSPIIEGEERDINYCKRKLEEMKNKGNAKASDLLKHYE